MIDFSWKKSRESLVVGMLAAVFVVAHSGVARAQAPVAAYSFDEDSGETVTDSAGDHDGAISGAIWISSGKYGSALEFDGENDLVSIADTADLDLTDSFTLEAWVQPDSLGAAQPVLSKGESSGGNSGYLLSAENGSNAAGYVASSGGDEEVADSSMLPSAEWSHLAFTSDGTSLRLYVGGTLVATESTIAAKATNANLEIGRSAFGGYFNGMIDEVRLYGEARSESQIQIDRDTAVGLDQIPVAAYSFDEDSGEMAHDSAGDHDGIIEGASWASSGKYGSALEFDGKNDLVLVADAADLDLTKSFTLEAWVRPDTTANWRAVISKEEVIEEHSTGYLLLARGEGGKARGYAAGSAVKAVTAPTPLPVEAWSHLAFTSDGTTLRIYINDVEVANNEAATVKATMANLEIGHWSLLNTYFDGKIDEIRIYNEALNETQIATDRENRVQPVPSHEVATTLLDSGPTAELVSSVPITAEGIETTIYSLEVPKLETDEILRVMGNLEVTNDNTYDVTDSVRLVIGSNQSDSGGTQITPWTNVTHTPEMRHWTLPVSGVFRAKSELGTQYVKLILKASSNKAEEKDTLTVQSNFGRVALTRATPTDGPMSQPTHELQSQIDPLPELVTSIPVDSSWQRIMTRRVSELSYNDLLEIASQLDVQNTSSATVLVESKITRTTTPSTAGSWASPPITDRLSPAMPSSRIVHSSPLLVSDPGKPYLNLSVRAVPVSGSPTALTVATGATILDVLHYKADMGDPTVPLGKGTVVEEAHDYNPPNVSFVPYAPGSAPEPRVVASVPLYGGLWKDELIRARGLVTVDLDGADKAQLLTSIVLADNPTATSGETIGVFSGDMIHGQSATHTVIKEGNYVAPQGPSGD